MLSPLQRFWRLLIPDKKEIIHVYIYAIFGGLVNLSLPLGIQAIVNLIQGGQVSTSWVILVIIVVLGILFTGTLQLMQLRVIENLQQKLFARAAFEFTYRIPKIKTEALYKYYAPELMNRFFDTLSVQKGLSKILVDFSSASLQILFGLILLSFYHSFFIVFSVLLVLLVIIIFKLTGKKGLETSLKESKYKYHVAHWLEELARTKDSFKLAGNSPLPLKRTDEQVVNYLGSRESHFNVLRQQYLLMIGFKSIVAAGLLVIGGLLVLNQQMNIGQFIAAEIIILLVINSVEKLITSIENIYDVLTSLEKIGQVTDLETETEDGDSFAGTHPEKNGLKVELKNIEFTYPSMKDTLIQQLSLVVQPGEKICLTGKNGSGKSTLLSLIAGLYQPQKGTICFNDLPVGNFNLSSIRSFMGNGLSEERIFQGSVFDNISLGREQISFEDVQWAAENSGLTSFIQQLPQGFNTELETGGIKLAKSTIRKILFARAIVNKPRLLLLENGFEHIEDIEKTKLIDFVTAKERPWTLIAVCPDAYLIKKCDRTITLGS